MNTTVNKFKLIFLLLATASVSVFAQVKETPVPQIIEKNGRHALMVEGQPFLILGGQAHNSSGWPGMMPQVWQAMEAMHANTLEVPIYWEQIEAQQGKYDFSIVDSLLKQGREHNVHLVFLWFATWKNGSNHYMPEWMKREPSKYPNITGKKCHKPEIRLQGPDTCKMGNSSLVWALWNTGTTIYPENIPET